ncbi:MAG: hypothetical protein ACE5GE_03640 [Phycisphaerae bacterium]
MNQLFAVALFLLAGPPSDLIEVSARIETDQLEVGTNFDIELTLETKSGFSATAAGLPAPILQIDLPNCVKLEGHEITDYRQLARNEFLHEPYERLVNDSPLIIPCKLLEKPQRKDHIALNILAYVSPGAGDQAHFVRQRHLLRVKPRAKARQRKAVNSDWGALDVLQIGDTAPTFTLQSLTGSEVSLDSYLGKKNIIVTTYRAFW